MKLKCPLWFIAICSIGNCYAAANILRIMDGKSVNQFSSLLTSHADINPFTNGELTVFAPSDDALSKYKGSKDSQFILNHMVNVVVKIGETNSFSSVIRISSMSPGSPPLYISRQGVDYYVNGAKIIMRNLQATSDNGKRQRLHILDRVLEPLSPRESDEGDSAVMVGLTAGKLLRQTELFQLNISRFAAQVKALGKLELFDQPGQNTFFIPVDRAFENLSIKLVDSEIIPGHVIPGKLLFTRPIFGTEQKTATFSTNVGIQVTAVIQQSRDTAQVKSVTAKGSLENPRGEYVIADIVRANIPVSNGVVHLIDRPLVVIASTLWDYLQSEKGGTRLSRFAEHLQRHGGDLEQLIRSSVEGTVFAPSNEAFTSVVEELMKNKEKAKQILGLHFVDKRIAGDDVRVHKPQNGLAMYDAQVPYPEGTRNKLWLYFKNNETLFVDGLGAFAEVIEADIGATNGVIHVIDKVLGVPSQTIFNKLANDPMLSSAFSLGNQEHFNKDFKDEGRKFTFLVPSDQAWEEIRQKFASAHKQLFMGDFGYQSKSILERHLRIGESLSADELVRRSAADDGIQMLRGMPLKFVRETDDNGVNATYVLWEDLKARLVRPDLNCTNGYVHVIDQVLMKRRDVTLSGTGCNNNQIIVTLLLSVTVALYSKIV